MLLRVCHKRMAACVTQSFLFSYPSLYRQYFKVKAERKNKESARTHLNFIATQLDHKTPEKAHFCFVSIPYTHVIVVARSPTLQLQAYRNRSNIFHNCAAVQKRGLLAAIGQVGSKNLDKMTTTHSHTSKRSTRNYRCSRTVARCRKTNSSQVKFRRFLYQLLGIGKRN